MNSFCPPHLAFSGDNVGLLIGSSDKTVSKVLITLDVDEKVASEAAAMGADAIISHHPLMFHPTKRLTDATPAERTLVSLVKSNIALFSAHTNLDCANGGLNDYLAKKLGLQNTRVIDVVDTVNGVEHGYGRVGTLKEKNTLHEVMSRCIDVLQTPFVKYVGNPDKIISTVAVNCGAGSDAMDFCIENKVDLFVTGDVKYNPARDAMENNMALIDAGHYETEHIVCELLFDVLSSEFTDVEFVVSKQNIPVFNVYYK